MLVAKILIHALRLPCPRLAEDIEESLSAEERPHVRTIRIIYYTD